MRAVVDTNVLVSALLSRTGPPRMILRLLLSKKMEWLVNDLVLEEYEEVLGRKDFGFKPSQIKTLMEFIGRYAVHAPYVPQKVSIPHADDLPFLLCAHQGKADTLITGNKKHFPFPKQPFRIESPAEFVTRIS